MTFPIAFLSVIDSEKDSESDLDVLLRSGYRYAMALTHDRSEARVQQRWFPLRAHRSSGGR